MGDSTAAIPTATTSGPTGATSSSTSPSNQRSSRFSNRGLSVDLSATARHDVDSNGSYAMPPASPLNATSSFVSESHKLASKLLPSKSSIHKARDSLKAKSKTKHINANEREERIDSQRSAMSPTSPTLPTVQISKSDTGTTLVSPVVMVPPDPEDIVFVERSSSFESDSYQSDKGSSSSDIPQIGRETITPSNISSLGSTLKNLRRRSFSSKPSIKKTASMEQESATYNRNEEIGGSSLKDYFVSSTSTAPRPRSNTLSYDQKMVISEPLSSKNATMNFPKSSPKILVQDESEISAAGSHVSPNETSQSIENKVLEINELGNTYLRILDTATRIIEDSKHDNAGYLSRYTRTIEQIDENRTIFVFNIDAIQKENSEISYLAGVLTSEHKQSKLEIEKLQKKMDAHAVELEGYFSSMHLLKESIQQLTQTRNFIQTRELLYIFLSWLLIVAAGIFRGAAFVVRSFRRKPHVQG